MSTRLELSHRRLRGARFMWPASIALLLAAILIATGGGIAYAYWSATSTAGSAGAARAATVNQGATPTASATGTTISVNWAAGTLSTGTAATGYIVKRYDVATLTAQTVLAGCAGTITTTSCTESGVPVGQWKYSVTPLFATNWIGPESSLSTPVWSDSTPPTNVLDVANRAGSGSYLTGSTVYYKGSSAGTFQLSNSLTDSGSGPASSTTTALAGTSTGWAHTPSTVSSPVGGPYISNVFSWTAGTTSNPTETVTGTDNAGQTSATTLSFVNDSTAPSAGTITYQAGAISGTTLSISFTTGTDAGSGIGARQLQRATAPLSGTTCGTFGAFATVTGGNNPVSPFTDTVTAGNCYQYQYVVQDIVGNTTTATSPNIATKFAGAYWALDAGSGTNAIDSWGNGNNGTLQSGATWTTGRIGTNAVSLNGLTGYIDDPATAIDTTQSYTVSAWVNLNNLVGFQTIASIDGASASAFYLQMQGGKFAMTVRTTDSTTGTQILVPALAAPTVGTWYHIAGVYDSSTQTIALYVNGTLQGTASFTNAWKGTGHTAIGRGKWNGANVDFTNGAVDDVHMFQSALTQTQIATLAAG